ncbi:Uncharacterized protein APZ42_011403 [Daphnia magna]|uniref:Uncharacterized protein n=1 Tax=Daphnia magna TaxID=35525 RepID=A0A0P6CG66_9CRUS|nr:Uncharacterized protein APZ42_011403 [Daphnia magna]
MRSIKNRQTVMIKSPCPLAPDAPTGPRSPCCKIRNQTAPPILGLFKRTRVPNFLYYNILSSPHATNSYFLHTL